ncbi:MAG: copper ion binding protein [Oscillospiraceae bacterium]|nr:copper ion binding protein [Oscillospiraceae bacterium]
MAITKTLNVEGMSCKHCVMNVSKALSAIPGVKKVDVNLDKGLAKVKMESDISDSVFGAAITEAGYDFKGVAA